MRNRSTTSAKGCRVFAASLGFFLLWTAGFSTLPGWAQKNEEATSSASLPLEEVLRLYREIDQSRKLEAPPPVAASITRLRATGRLRRDAVDLQARFDISVLEDGSWVKLPLVEMEPGTSLSQLPSLPSGATVAVEGQTVFFVTRKQGVYQLELGLMRLAQGDGRKRKATLAFGPAALATLDLELDENLFRLTSPGAMQEAKGFRLYPRGGRFEVSWEQLGAADRSAPEKRQRPPIDPVIPTAHGSLVSTLEGKAILRARYELRFEGRRQVTFNLPQGLELEKVFLNGARIPFEVAGSVVEIAVEPARAGDPGGTVELVAKTARKEYLLSGDLAFAFPSPSWTVNELFLDLHLPEVFTYSWSGGSLSPVTSAPQVTFAYQIPSPGKRLSFHQYLVTGSTPAVRLKYDIDLEGQYFEGL